MAVIMPGSCSGCTSEEECRRCLIIQTAKILDSDLGESGEGKGDLYQLEGLIAIARDKGLLSQRESALYTRKVAQAAQLLEDVRVGLYLALEEGEEKG